MRPGALEQRIKAQTEILARAKTYVKPGGRLVYVTCSLLREENEDRVADFLAQNPEFSPEPAEESLQKAGLSALSGAASPHGPGIRLTPARHDVDGFYIAVLRRG
jgi:16S rRNA (cytosine967-C5)-methyltransferase